MVKYPLNMEIISVKKEKKEIVEKAIQTLKEGKLLIYPTETCYGLGADATSKKAIENLLKYKSRREGKPLSVIIPSKEEAKKYTDLNDMAENIYDNYLPGPITVVSKSLGKVVKEVESESGTLGIRVPKYELVLEISKNFKKPFTATSANMSYMPKPYNIQKMLKKLPKKKKDLIGLVIDAGELPKNETSTVVDTTLNTMNILREGKINFEKSLKSPKLSAKTLSEEETISFGTTIMLKYIDEVEEKTLVFLLSGELGTGKTQLTKGIAKQLRITKLIKSPTYNILNEYEYSLGEKKGKLIHIDMWKIFSWEEFLKIGILEYMEKGNIFVIEWGDKFFKETEKFFSKKNTLLLKVNFEYKAEEERYITVF